MNYVKKVEKEMKEMYIRGDDIKSFDLSLKANTKKIFLLNFLSKHYNLEV